MPRLRRRAAGSAAAGDAPRSKARLPSPIRRTPAAVSADLELPPLPPALRWQLDRPECVSSDLEAAAHCSRQQQQRKAGETATTPLRLPPVPRLRRSLGTSGRVEDESSRQTAAATERAGATAELPSVPAAHGGVLSAAENQPHRAIAAGSQLRSAAADAAGGPLLQPDSPCSAGAAGSNRVTAAAPTHSCPAAPEQPAPSPADGAGTASQPEAAAAAADTDMWVSGMRVTSKCMLEAS